jgi:hypothetical protein
MSKKTPPIVSFNYLHLIEDPTVRLEVAEFISNREDSFGVT